jgi:hypothetical protein
MNFSGQSEAHFLQNHLGYAIARANLKVSATMVDKNNTDITTVVGIDYPSKTIDHVPRGKPTSRSYSRIRPHGTPDAQIRVHHHRSVSRHNNVLRTHQIQTG